MEKINLVSDTINKEDINALCQWLQQDEIPQLTKGALTRELEAKWAKKIGTKHSVFVNSGSSAILLLLAAYKQKFNKRPKIVVPAVSWATDVSIPMMLDYDILMCDCNFEDLSFELDDLEQIFKESSPDAVLLVTPLGLVPDMDRILNLCDQYDVTLFEDNCESMGSRYRNRMLGSFGDASCFSLYYGHHLSTIEGGFVNTNNEELYNLLIAIRSHGWDRDLNSYVAADLREEWKVSEFKALYTFYYEGLNLRSTDLQAFIGLRMLDRLEEFAIRRNKNFRYYKDSLGGNMLGIRDQPEDFISNFAYPMVCYRSKAIVNALRNNDIEVRPLIAGSMGQQPFWIKKYGRREFMNADIIHDHGFYLPNHQSLTTDDIDKIASIINNNI